MMLETVSPTRMFYWQVEFLDGTKIAQFDKEGNEVYVRDFASIESRIDPKDSSKGFDLKKNILAGLEVTHGRCVKVSWLPFTYRLKQNIISKQDISIEVVNEYKPIERRIPEGYFAHFFSSAIIEYGTNFISPNPLGISAHIGELYLGYLPREGTGKKGIIDRIIIKARRK